MAMEKYYDTPRSWFMNHIDDDDNNVGIDDNDGIVFRYPDCIAS